MGGSFLVYHKAAGAIVRSVVTGLRIKIKDVPALEHIPHKKIQGLLCIPGLERGVRMSA
jgi:hypothetical protein